MNLEKIIMELKEKGFRETPLRTALLEVLIKEHGPLSVQDIATKLKGKGLTPNATTLYRQLDTLVSNDIVELVVLDPKVQLFEIKHDHHHHFVCEGCSEVQDVHSEEIERAFSRFESELERKGLSIKKHELTFMGECQSCH